VVDIKFRLKRIGWRRKKEKKKREPEEKIKVEGIER
jgi:hypothetical protein